jgi:hypothetical protein
MDIPAFMKKLVIEESKTNDDIGLPVSIICLAKDKIEWIQKGLCE